MKRANDIASELSLSRPPHWAETYTFDGDWNKRQSRNPWTWWAPDSKRDIFPHFTVWADDVGKDGYLKSFHITINYGGQTHKPLHFYYRVNEAGKVTFKSTDANRLESEKRDGLNWGDANATSIDTLAQKFVDAAVGG